MSRVRLQLVAKLSIHIVSRQPNRVEQPGFDTDVTGISGVNLQSAFRFPIL